MSCRVKSFCSRVKQNANRSAQTTGSQRMGFSQKSAVVLRQRSRIDSIVKELELAHHHHILPASLRARL
jgi:hypothetical protein